MTEEPVVVTGIGAITPIGTGADGLWQGAMAGRSAVRTVTRFDPSLYISHVAAEVNDFDPTHYLDAKQVRRYDRYSQFSVACAQMALEDAGLSPENVDRSRVGVCLGTALGGVGMAEAEHIQFLEKGPKGVAFMFVGGRIARVEVDEPGVRTAAGAQVGDTEARIKSLYPGIKSEPHHYEDGHYLIYTPKDAKQKKYRLIFETNGKTVTRYRAGALPAVEWIEGCS